MFTDLVDHGSHALGALADNQDLLVLHLLVVGALRAQSHLQLVLNTCLGLFFVGVVVEVDRGGEGLGQLELEGDLVVAWQERLALSCLREMVARLLHMQDIAI